MKRLKVGILAVALIVTLVSATVFAADQQEIDKQDVAEATYGIRAMQEYCHGVTISPAGYKEYAADEEITYTIKGSGDIKPSYFVVDGKRVEGTLIDEYTMTYTFTDEMKESSYMIYGIGEETPDSTYTVDVTILPSNGIHVSKTGVDTYSSDEEATYTLTGMGDIAPGYFVINGERVEGIVGDDNTLSYTFPKGTAGVYTLYGATEDFRDVSKTDWFYDNVTYVNEKGIMTGLDSNTFGSSQPIVRAQFAVILYRMAGEPELLVEPATKCIDVDYDSWYGNAVKWVFVEEIMRGYSDSNYWGTADNLNREQMVTTLYRFAQYMGYDVSDTEDISKYTDAASVNDFSKEAMSWAVGSGIIEGKDNGTRIDPQGDSARAECAAVIQRFMEKYE